MKTKINYLRKHNDVNTYSQTISIICSEKEFMDMATNCNSYSRFVWNVHFYDGYSVNVLVI